MDPNGDPLAFRVAVGPVGMTVTADGLVKWRPTASQFGANAVRLEVDDGRGGIAVQEFTVAVTSQDADAAPAVTPTAPGGATVGRQYRYDAAASDPDGDSVTGDLITGPAGLAIDAAGRVRWTPAADQLGDFTVTIRVPDAHGASAGQTFALTVRPVNAPPRIVSTPPTEAALATPYRYAVNAIDPDGDPLTFRLAAAPAGMSIDPNSGVVTWTPAAGQLGSHTVEVRAERGRGGGAMQRWTLLVTAVPGNRRRKSPPGRRSWRPPGRRTPTTSTPPTPKARHSGTTRWPRTRTATG